MGIGVLTIIGQNIKVGMTPEGGIAIRLTNKTGSPSVKGELVKAGIAVDDSVILTAANDDEGFGVIYEDGIVDGSEVWVVIAGIADVMLEDTSASVRGNWVGTSGTAGRADATTGSPPAAPTHFEEFGHCIESKGGGVDVLARCVLHFN